MAEQQIDIRYVKSPLWRVVSATGAAIGGIGTPTAGMEIMIRFTMEWVDVEKESFRAEVDLNTGTFMVLTPSQFQLAELTKMEEVAVKMSTEGAVGLIVGLISQFGLFSEAQKQRLKDEFAKLSKN
jgi:hypothetical protein